MFRTTLAWFKGLTAAGKAGVVIASVVGLSAVSAATNDSSQQQQPTQTQDKPASSQKADAVTHKTVTITEAIPFETIQQNSGSLAKGTKKILTTGVDGERKVQYDVTYTNGVETSRVKLSEEITTKPVNEVIALGTYEAPQLDCPNGTYVNTSGNTVCRPYESTTVPAGATAKCYDGTYSFSQHRSGTCSHHGGVAEWL